MSRVVLVASLLILLASTGEAVAVGVPANTAIELIAGADFVDAMDTPRTSDPVVQMLVVKQVAGAEIDAVPCTKEVGPSETVYVPLHIVNTGNGSDDFALTATPPAGWTADIVYDYDDNGVHDPTDNTVIDETGEVVADGYLPCFARITTPAHAGASGEVTVCASSTCDTGLSDTVDLAITALEAPVIHVTTPTSDAEFSRNSASLLLKGTATDNTGVASVEWSNATTGGSGQCTFSAPDWTATDISLAPGENDLSVQATDLQGTPSSVALKVSYIEASPGDAWRGLSMVSIPLIPDETDPEPVVGFDQDYWLSFSPDTNSYLRYPDQQTFLDPAEGTPARGFWTHFSGQAPEPVGTIPKQDQPVSIHLKPGWNLVGQPFITTISWSADDILVQRPGHDPMTLRDSGSIVSGFAWGWRQNAANPDTGSYYLVCDPTVFEGADAEMEPWHAYWVKAFAECDLILPPPSQ